MKKVLFSLILLLAGQIVYAQDLNQLMDDMAKVENAQKQVMDKNMLNNMPKDNMPAFMSKMDSVVVVVLQSCPEDLSAEFTATVSAAEKSDAYEPLVLVKEENNRVSILSGNSEGDVTEVYIYVVSDGGVTVFVKMTGSFTADDLMDIVKEQQKNNN
jgi:hypothetical protein